MLDYSKRKCYGFIKNKNSEFVIDEIESKNVKLIFECFLKGMSLSEISKELHSREISSPSGKDTWSRKVLSSTLSNEKYHLYGIVSFETFEFAQANKTQRVSKSNTKIVDDAICSEADDKLCEKESIEEKVVENILEDYATFVKNVDFYKQWTKCISQKNLIDKYFNTRTKNRIMQSSIKLFEFVMRRFLLERAVLLC